ncbi:hypothetical protein ABW19_dt0206203 [Dactylella cylindrospora]|nr:hypothetical protein ABW19_dt0206203 [Dactylella cylindrospora]
MPTFKFRNATVSQGDDVFFLEAWDSTFPYIASIGSKRQWDNLPSTQPTSVERVKKVVADADAALSKYPYDSTNWGTDWCRAYAAEVDVEKDKIPELLKKKYASVEGEVVTISVGAMALTSKSPEYVRPVIPEQDEADPFLYLAFLMNDHRAGPYAKGAGAALLELAKEEVRKVGLKRLCGDCWRGNERRLVKYYEGQGLRAIGDFDAPKPEGEIWPGAVTEWKI